MGPGRHEKAEHVSRRRNRRRSGVDVLDDVDWQDKRVRIGISALGALAAVGVLLGTLDDARSARPPSLSAGVGLAAMDEPAPPASTAAAPGGPPAPTVPLAQPHALAATTTTVFVPTTARPTTAPPTTVVFDLRPVPTCSVSRAVRPGSSGDDVRCVQTRLRQITPGGTGADPDGRFGPGTETAVRQFQLAHGLGVDGVVGASTARLLGIWDEPGDGV